MLHRLQNEKTNTRNQFIILQIYARMSLMFLVGQQFLCDKARSIYLKTPWPQSLRSQLFNLTVRSIFAVIYINFNFSRHQFMVQQLIEMLSVLQNTKYNFFILQSSYNLIDLNTNFRLSSKKLSPPKNTVSNPKDHLTPNYRGVIHPSDPLGNKLAYIEQACHGLGHSNVWHPCIDKKFCNDFPISYN